MNKEIFSIILVFFIYWYFNVKKQDYITVNLPIEKMSNVSIFKG